MDAARGTILEHPSPTGSDVQQPHAGSEIQRPEHCFQFVLGGLLQGFTVGFKNAMRVKPISGVNKREVEIIAERVMLGYRFLIDVSVGPQEQVCSKANRGPKPEAVAQVRSRIQ